MSRFFFIFDIFLFYTLHVVVAREARYYRKDLICLLTTAQGNIRSSSDSVWQLSSSASYKRYATTKALLCQSSAERQSTNIFKTSTMLHFLLSWNSWGSNDHRYSFSLSWPTSSLHKLVKGAERLFTLDMFVRWWYYFLKRKMKEVSVKADTSFFDI